MKIRMERINRVTVLTLMLTFILLVTAVKSSYAADTDDIIFIHKSVGRGLLRSGGMENALIAKDYIDEVNEIYTRSETPYPPPDTGRPDSVSSYGSYMCDWILWFNDYLEGVKYYGCEDGVNRIIMFKSCYPYSNISSDGTEPGNPFSSARTLTNYMAIFRHPNGPGNTYTHSNGYTYKPLEDIFAENPDTIFVYVTAPPLYHTSTNEANARRARIFNNWLKNEWLPNYNAAHPELNNAAIFDLFDVLANPDDHPEYPNMLREEYYNGVDDHPNTAGYTAGAEAFAGPGNVMDAAWEAYSGRGYSLSININGNGQVTKTPDQARYDPGDIVTLEAIPDAGHIFQSWSGNLTGSTNPVDITMNSNKYITANFVPEPPKAPVAVISALPISGEAPLAVNFDGSSSSDPDGNIEKYEWDFENNGIVDAQGVTTSYTYNDVGTYTAKLTVTDNQGLTDTDTVTIKVLKEGEEFGRLPTGCYNNVINPLKGEKATIMVELEERGYIKIDLYDTKGNKIKKIADEEREADTHEYYWDGKDDSNNIVGSGLYFVHIEAGDYKKTKKIVVVK
jgi:PKD repeat protein